MTDLHVHSFFCDGKNSPEELVLTAVEKGVTRLGILAHSYMECDEEGSLPPSRVEEFQRTVGELKEKYRDKITLLCGLEKDIFSSQSTDGFDYVIGSVHYVKIGETLYPIDLSAELFEKAAKALDGDYYALAELYFKTVANVVEKTNADIIGHFDLITKFNDKRGYFDVNHPRYVKAYKLAADKLLESGKPFEINVGGMSRGHKFTPYPSPEITAYLRSKNAKLMLSSDAHEKSGIAFEFEKWNKY
jgi:histidinol-phosphatase (PHP family)